jgi:hypothetical protein
VRVAYTARPKTKESATSFSYSYIYMRNKSHHEIFLDENDKPDRKSLQQVMHGVQKARKKMIRFYIEQTNAATNKLLNVLRKRKLRQIYYYVVECVNK